MQIKNYTQNNIKKRICSLGRDLKKQKEYVIKPNKW